MGECDGGKTYDTLNRRSAEFFELKDLLFQGSMDGVRVIIIYLVFVGTLQVGTDWNRLWVRWSY